jgi:hypothetical protein
MLDFSELYGSLFSTLMLRLYDQLAKYRLQINISCVSVLLPRDVSLLYFLLML